MPVKPKKCIGFLPKRLRMHRFLAETAEKPQGYQVEQSVDEAFQTELADSVFAFLMPDRLFGDARKTGVLGQIRDISVHFAIDFDVFHDFVPICLEAAVHVVQTYAGDLPCCPVVQL